MLGSRPLHFSAGLSFFLAGSPTSQPLLRQVGTPNFGRSHCVRTSQTIKTRANPIHWFMCTLIVGQGGDWGMPLQVERFCIEPGSSIESRSPMIGSLTRVQQLAVLLHLFEKRVDGEVRLLVEEVYEGIVGGGDRRRSFFWRNWFQTVWLDEEIDGFAVHAQNFDQPADLLALVGGGLEELDAHAKFRVGEADDANRAFRRAGWADRKDYAGGCWER